QVEAEAGCAGRQQVVKARCCAR
ncbi:hypothetical protein BN1723_019504, partial [Verticillium longisporum]